VSEPILLRAAPGASADLFHAVPLDILDGIIDRYIKAKAA